MRTQRVRYLVIAGTAAVVLGLSAAASASPTVKAVPQSAAPGKHFIQLKPGMQRTAFISKSGLSKKQILTSLDLSSKKQRPQ